MTDLYVQTLKFEDDLIDGKVFNAGYENHKVMDIAKMVKQGVGGDVDIVTVPTDDNRSYHISSEKIRKELGFTPNHTIDDAVTDLVGAFGKGSIPDSMTGDRYYNIKVMQSLHLK
jgi:nucleoside-diphosphate-sugar epimerase